MLEESHDAAIFRPLLRAVVVVVGHSHIARLGTARGRAVRALELRRIHSAGDLAAVFAGRGKSAVPAN